MANLVFISILLLLAAVIAASVYARSQPTLHWGWVGFALFVLNELLKTVVGLAGS